MEKYRHNGISSLWNTASILLCQMSIYRPREGNVFTGVCHSVQGVDPVHLFLSLSLKTVFRRKPPPITVSTVASDRKNLNKSHFTILFLNKCISISFYQLSGKM